MGKVYARFQTKKAQKPYPWGRGKDYNREDRKIVYSAGRLLD